MGFWGAILLALVVGSEPAAGAPAGPSAARAATKACPPGQGQIVVQRRGRTLRIAPSGRGRRVCVGATADRSAYARYAADRRRLRKVRLAPRRLARRLLRASRRDALVTARMRRALELPPARAARTVDVTIERRQEIEPGKWTSGRFEREIADPDEVGGGTTVTAVVEMDAALADKAAKKGEADLSQLERYGDSAFAKRCPDAEGKVAIEHTYLLRSATTVDTRTVSASHGVHLEYSARGTATVGDDGLAKHFSYRFDARLEHFASSIGRRGNRDRWIKRRPARLTFNDERVPVAGTEGHGGVEGRWTTGSARTADAQEAALAALAGHFVADTRRSLRKVIQRAQVNWFDDRQCVRVDVRPTGGTDYVRGGVVGVEAEVVSAVDGTPVQGGTVTWQGSCVYAPVTPESGPAPLLRATMRDAESAWTPEAPPCAVFGAVTRRGRAPDRSYEWPKPPPEEWPWRYEVLDASFDEQTDAAQSGGSCSEIGGTAGSKHFGGTFASALPSTVERRSDGRLAGSLEARAHASWTGHRLTGCEYTDDGIIPCQRTMADRTPGGDGTIVVRARVDAASATAPTATLSWSVNMPEVGFVDSGNPECNVYILGFLPQEVTRQEVPLSRLAAKGPQTFEFGGAHRLTQNAWGDPATIDQAWTLRLTVRRVDAQGRPL